MGQFLPHKQRWRYHAPYTVMNDKELTIGFIGNPNCGKTTLFNAYTGANLKVANWPGVTVEKVEGAIRNHNETIHLVDLPGTYSLTSYTIEETVTRNFILSDEVNVIINVADASALERSLYLTLQLLELGKPIVLALNMMDIVIRRGMEIDLHRLPEMLGIPVVSISARKGRGLDILLHTACHHQNHIQQNELIHDHDSHIHSNHQHNHHKEFAMVYSDLIEDKIDKIIPVLKEKYPDIINYRWHAIKLLEGDLEISRKYPVDLPQVLDRSYESDIINQKYDFITEIINEVLVHKQRQDRFTENVDKYLTHNYLGVPIFLGMMAVIFFLTFMVGDFIKSFIELGLGLFSTYLQEVLTDAGSPQWLESLLVGGVLSGVGTILTFLPNILILFVCLAILEDSGYMSRVAYVMEGIMSRLGLSGKAFIPMLLGFGCTVPAIMASRALELKRDRFKVMLVTPFMSCNARLTIYILFSEMFFPNKAMFVAYSLYLIGLIIAILISFVVHLMDRSKHTNYLLIELPEYKMPAKHTVAIYVWEKIKDYLEKAGTTIFIATLIIWALLNFNLIGYVNSPAESIAATIGHICEPFFAPIGLGFWQIVVALIAGISAKEVVVSSCAVLFGIASSTANNDMTDFAVALQSIGFNSLNAFCLMVFCLLYIPCVASLATIRKESGSNSWMIFTILFQLTIAWIVTFAIYNIGLALGF